MFENEKCLTLRSLIDFPIRDKYWFDEVKKVTNFNQYMLMTPRSMIKAFRPEWGRIHVRKISRALEYTWYRPDEGPSITISTDQSPTNVILKLTLMALLILELKKCELLSFVKTGYPKEWNRCTIFVNEQEIQSVIWACAIIGMCSIHDTSNIDNKKGEFKEKIICGHVEVKIMKQQKSFF